MRSPVACVVAAWHLVEHDVIMMSFLATGIPGSPGLLASGGSIDGGLPLARADLHFVYNIVEAVTIAVAYGWQLRAEGASLSKVRYAWRGSNPRPQRS